MNKTIYFFYDFFSQKIPPSSDPVRPSSIRMKISPDPKEIEIRSKRHSISFQIPNKNVHFFSPATLSGFNPELKTPDFGRLRSRTAC